MIGMKKEDFLRDIAIFMAFLVISIPLISSQAVALSITKVTVAGSDGVENVMKSDNDYFTATVGISEEVDPDQIYISYTKNEAFDECTGSTCTYASSQTDRAGQEMEYTIQLLNNSVVVDEVEGTILIDENEPTIEDYDVEKDGEDIVISYEIEDTACDDCTTCSGIDYLLLYQDDEVIDEINIASVCSLDDEIETSVTDLNLEDGEHELCLQAVDNVGYESDIECSLINVDVTGPHFETDSVVLIDKGTRNVVEYIGNDAILVNVYVNITDDILDENTVRADLSALNSLISETYENVSVDSCEEEDGVYTCVWESYYVEEVSGSLSLKFWAYDDEGNYGSYTSTYTLTKDGDAPTVYDVYTKAEFNDVYFKSGKNSLYADLDPTGSAFENGEVYLTFGTAGMDEDEADDCWDNGSYWTCEWNFSLSSSASSRTGSITIDATDDAGNEMESYDVDIVIDSEEPEITSISTSLSCPTAYDSLEVVVNATDDISDELYVYFYGSDIRTDDDPIVEKCVEYDVGQFTCVIYVDDLVTYSTDENVDIEVMDLAGNVADDDIDIDVCELEEAGEPDFVKLHYDDPEDIDLLTLSYIDLPVYVDMEFSVATGAHIVSKSATCEDTGNVYFIDDLMVITLEKQSLSNTTTELNLDCTMYLTMEYGDSVYANPEIEEFEVDIGVYGTPLGSIEGSIQDKINYEISMIAGSQANIDKLVKWNRILGIMCKIAELLAKLDAILAGTRVITTAIAVAIYEAIYAPPATFVATPIYEGIVMYHAYLNTYHGFISKTIWPVGYTKLLSIGSVVKYGCIIYSGRLCEGFQGIENTIITRGEGGGVGEAGTQTYYSYNNNTAVESGILSGTLFADWDPYRSIHTAKSCLYLDAIIYNLRKERQIHCMYTTCLEENAKNGLSTEVCEAQLQERQCLYVDGAAWLSMGPTSNIKHFFQLVINTFFSNLDILALSTVYTFTYCGTSWESELGKFYSAASYVSAPYPLMISDTACHLAAGGFELAELGWFKETFDFDFQANLEGTDYCAPYGNVAVE